MVQWKEWFQRLVEFLNDERVVAAVAGLILVIMAILGNFVVGP
jgi:hypothetical protein